MNQGLKANLFYKVWHLPALVLTGVLLCATASVAWGAPGWQFIPAPANVGAPQLAGVDRAGHAWRLDALKGRAVLINFWASWCEPCVTEMPSLQTLSQRHGVDKLVVLAVNFKQSTPAIDAFVERTGLTLPVLIDAKGDIARQWGIKIFPSTVLVDTQGKVHGTVQGELVWTGPEAAALLQPLVSKLH